MKNELLLAAHFSNCLEHFDHEFYPGFYFTRSK